MTREIPTRDPFAEMVKTRLTTTLDALPTNHPVKPLHVAVLNSHWKIEWSRRKPDAEVGRMIDSTVASINYAHFSTGRGYIILNTIDEKDPKKWEAVIDDVLRDEQMQEVFYRSLGRAHITAIPE